MNITVQDVFDQAIHLMDEQNEINGETVTSDTKEYRLRTISILNTIIPRLYPYSKQYTTDEDSEEKNIALNRGTYSNPDFTQIIQLDNELCMSVLPFYLAAHLISVENESLSAFFMNQYRESFSDVKKTTASTFQQISTPYGLF